jgi:hypothetical protein
MGYIGVSFPQPVPEKSLGKSRQLKRLQQPLLGRHRPENLDITLMIGSFFGIHGQQSYVLWEPAPPANDKLTLIVGRVDVAPMAF